MDIEFYGWWLVVALCPSSWTILLGGLWRKCPFWGRSPRTPRALRPQSMCSKWKGKQNRPECSPGWMQHDAGVSFPTQFIMTGQSDRATPSRTTSSMPLQGWQGAGPSTFSPDDPAGLPLYFPTQELEVPRTLKNESGSSLDDSTNIIRLDPHVLMPSGL